MAKRREYRLSHVALVIVIAAQLADCGKSKNSDGGVPPKITAGDITPADERAWLDNLRPKFQDGSFGRARLLTRKLASEEAIALGGAISVESSPPPAALPQIRQALEVFTTRVIPEVVPIGIATQRLLINSETNPPA